MMQLIFLWHNKLIFAKFILENDKQFIFKLLEVYSKLTYDNTQKVLAYLDY